MVSSIYIGGDDYYQAASKDDESEPRTHPKMQKLFYKYRAMSFLERIFGRDNNNYVYPIDNPGLGIRNWKLRRPHFVV